MSHDLFQNIEYYFVNFSVIIWGAVLWRSSGKCKCIWLRNRPDLRNKRNQFGEITVFVNISTMNCTNNKCTQRLKITHMTEK